MTMKLEIAAEVQAGLLAQARASGLTLEEYAEKVLRERAQESMAAVSPDEPFWKSFTRQVHALPDEVFERLPEDGASEHDHYLYGARGSKTGSSVCSSLLSRDREGAV